MATAQPHRPRNIIVLCDATGKNGQRDSAKGAPITNIWRLYQAIQPQEGDIIEYLPGVGAYNDEVTAMDLLALTFGHTAVILIRKIYTTIAENYKDGDRISLFGYSRGAFIARKVASLIGALGLITNEAEFKQYWEGLEHKLPGNRSAPRPPNPRVVPISCLGVWDTVGKLNAEYQRAVRPRAIREELNFLTLPDNDLPEIVQSALHVVAYHENRKLFNVTLFGANDSDKQLCKQTLFPGSHSDVGGGVAPKHGRNILPDVTLDWMLRNMPQTIQVTTKEKLESDVPSWYPINSAFHDSPLWKRIPDKLYQREHLPTRYGLFRHRTLLGLPSPKSPHLLKHMWREWEHFNSPEEEANGPPVAKQSIIRRITDKAKSSMTPTWDRPALPLTPESPTFPAGTTRSADLQLPQQRRLAVRSRLDSSTTNQTDYTTDMLDTVSTPRTSLASMDIPLEAQAWLFANGPESPSTPVRTPLLPIAEDAHPVTEKAEKPKLGAEGAPPPPPNTPNRIGPVAGKPAPTGPAAQVRRAVPGRAGAQARPAPVQGRPGPAQIPLAPAQAPAVPVGPAAQAGPGPAQVSPAPAPAPTRPGPTQVRPAPVPVAPGSTTPTGPSPGQEGHTPVQTGRAPAQVRRAPAQVRRAPAQVRPDPVQAHPSAAQAGSAFPASHPPPQVGPAPTQASPSPAQVRPSPVQVYPAAQVDPAFQSGYLQTRASAQVQPNRPRQKKGFIQKIMASLFVSHPPDRYDGQTLTGGSSSGWGAPPSASAQPPAGNISSECDTPEHFQSSGPQHNSTMDPALPLDALTQPRKYVDPPVTSRKAPPVALGGRQQGETAANELEAKKTPLNGLLTEKGISGTHVDQSNTTLGVTPPIEPTAFVGNPNGTGACPILEVAESIIISRKMDASEIVLHLIKSGCADVTDRLDLGQCEGHPIAGGGFGDIYQGALDVAREIYAWSKLKHPNVLELVGLSMFRGQLSIVSPWMENGTLVEYIAKNPGADRYQLCVQISAGLVCLHKSDTVHGDMKGLNILISDRGAVKLADFGNATRKMHTLEFTGTTEGSIQAPEVLKGESSYAKEADVYALGMTFLETVTGKIPFSDKVEPAVFGTVMAGKTPERPKELDVMETDKANILWETMLRCWDHKAVGRPSAFEVEHNLERIKKNQAGVGHTARA